jgi:NitT/TauT family transport system substrate-binding protein
MMVSHVIPSSPGRASGRSSCLLVLSALFLSAWGIAQARPLRVAYTHSFACVPLGIAEDKNYWADAGLQVELRGYQTSLEVVSALKSGEADMGYDMLGTWIDVAMSGTAISIVGETDWSNGGDKLLLRKTTHLTDVKGKPIAVCVRGSAVMLFLREALARESLSVPDFLFIEVPEQEKSLQLFGEGKLHAVVSNEPWAARIVDAGAVTIATTADFPGIAPEGFVARREQVDDATLKRFFTAWFRAVAFLHDPANANAVAETASIYAFAGTEAITAADVQSYAKSTPVHDATASLKQNDLEKGNSRLLIQRLRVLMRLQGKQVSEPELVKFFHLEPLREVAGLAAK